jgi:hypothetical protein
MIDEQFLPVARGMVYPRGRRRRKQDRINGIQGCALD